MNSVRPAPPSTWTTRRLMDWMTNHFSSRGIDSPRVCAEMLLAHVIGCERMRLYMDVDRPASEEEREKLRALTQRAAAHEPVQYLVGHAWFFSRQFDVNPSTLIPRPSTETIIEHVLQRERAELRGYAPVMADVGTGTGCIAVTLATRLPSARLIATDISAEALELAARNATRHGVAERIEFHEGDALEPLKHLAAAPRFDYICSNPPYISDAEWGSVERNVKDYEPARALRGGADGLDVIRRIVAGAAALLAPGGQIVVEIAHSQHDAALEIAAASGLGQGRVLKDHEGFHRVLVASVAM